MSYIYFIGGQVRGSASMGRFQELTDAPAFVGNAGKFLKLDGGGTKLEFADVVYGDLELSDLRCEKCGEPFKEGDKLVLVVVKVGEKTIKARPAHHNCIGGN